jgi:hypothetical protein
MKYVKLFENWLNEAEGGAVKPFDPKAPETTLVVDITQEDLLKDPNRTRQILESMFNRGMAKKDAPDVEEAISVIPLYVGSTDSSKDPFNVGNATEGSLRGKQIISSITLRDNNNKLYFLKTKMLAEQQLQDELIALRQNKTPIFIVKRDDYEEWYEEDNVKKIDSSNKNIIILFPLNNEKYEIKAAKDFSLNVEFSIFEKVRFMPISLGSIVQSLAANLGKSNFINDKEVKPQRIAELLGYKIPDNYTPKMGGIEVKAK